MPMSWEALVNTSRLGHRIPKAETGRSPFNSDHDKIIFSGAFRRLARKTQVHPLATNDHVHNRLTHSLEVACVGRSLGIPPCWWHSKQGQECIGRIRNDRHFLTELLSAPCGCCRDC
jgi:hypothetical protein